MSKEAAAVQVPPEQAAVEHTQLVDEQEVVPLAAALTKCPPKVAVSGGLVLGLHPHYIDHPAQHRGKTTGDATHVVRVQWWHVDRAAAVG